ncbi:hypothetical protein X805_31480 [Sphaerotilus natans subsp. natans DSM 6575]|uniref:Uncharacterized protein n=1 Tax=Sphaerotilus natans subsp. natans DSM 6575 TaxID=1286631 RepID=A0A059KIG6_9BURK|nr:hypothetical protein X805_31480 [Sphaerotilus natans subsp. natans DSM 6575]
MSAGAAWSRIVPGVRVWRVRQTVDRNSKVENSTQIGKHFCRSA